MKDHNIKTKTCYKMLKARLYEYEIQKKEEENQKQLTSKTDIGG